MYLFIGAHQADENVFSSQVKNKIFARRSRPVGPNESARFRDPRPLQSHAGFPRKSVVKRSNLVRHMWCINTLTPSNCCIRYAIRANAHVLCSLVNLLFSARECRYRHICSIRSLSLYDLPVAGEFSFPTFGAERTVFRSRNSSSYTSNICGNGSTD